MTSAQRAQMKKALQALEAQLLGKGARKVEPNRADETTMGTDEDEQPLNEMLQAIASSRNRSDTEVLARVRHALEKLAADADAFGECEECGEEIALGRLKAMPYAELCVNCQSKKDPSRTLPTRKRLTDYV